MYRRWMEIREERCEQRNARSWTKNCLPQCNVVVLGRTHDLDVEKVAPQRATFPCNEAARVIEPIGGRDSPDQEAVRIPLARDDIGKEPTRARHGREIEDGSHDALGGRREEM